MSLIIAWNLKDCIVMAADHRHTVYDNQGSYTGRFFDIPKTKLHSIGKYCYSIGGIQHVYSYVDDALLNMDYTIKTEQLLMRISDVCKEAYNNFISSEYRNLENEFTTLTIFLASNEGHWTFAPDNNFEPERNFEVSKISVMSTNNKRILELLKKNSSSAKDYIEVLNNTYVDVAKEIFEISPTYDFVCIPRNEINPNLFMNRRFYGKTKDSAFMEIGTGGGGNLADLKLFRGTKGGSFPVFSVYDDINKIELKAGLGDSEPVTFLYTTGEHTYGLGTWDFAKTPTVSGNDLATKEWVTNNFAPVSHTHTPV